MKTKFILFLSVPILLLALESCKTSQKPVSTSKNTNKVSRLNSLESKNFEENYYNGIKTKLIDNDVIKAIGYFEKCISIDDQNTGALYELAKLYMQQNKFPEAQKLLEKATQLDPQNKWYILALIETYSQQSNYEKTISTLRKLADITPFDIQIYLKLSDLYLMDHQPLKAIKVLDGVEQLSGILPEVIDRKRRIYLNIDKFDDAEKEMQKLIKAYPFNTEYIKALIDMYLMYDKTNNILPLYQKVLTIDSNDGKSQMMLADYYRNTNNPGLSLQYTEKIVRNPDLEVKTKLSYLMVTYAKEKITPETKQLLLKLSDIILDLNPGNSQVYAFKGDIYYNTNHQDSALNQYLKSLDNEKSNYLTWKKVMMLYFEQKNYIKAIEICTQASELFPTNAEIYFYEGIALMQQKKNSEAASILETGLSYVIKNKPLQQQFCANLGEVYHTLANYEKSDKYYDKALELDPNDGYVLNNFAYFLSLRKIRLEDAKRMSEKSLLVNPDNPANLDTYGWILYLLSDYIAAEQNISKALLKNPNDPDILEHYGDIQFKLGNIDKAVEQWQKAKNHGSTSKNLDKKISDKMLYE
jgi:tetratricopeptide (TPR) repeat protein